MSEVGSLGRAANILLVEDNLDDIKLTKLAFEETEVTHEIHVVHDGEQAMALLRQEGQFAEASQPDLILLDLNMPRKDGRAVLKEVKADADLRRIPVIVLTTSDSAIDRLFAYSQHANAYLVKPMDIDEWHEMVRGISLFWLKLVRHSPAAPRTTQSAATQKSAATERCPDGNDSDPQLESLPVINWEQAADRLPGGCDAIRGLAQTMRNECQKHLADIQDGIVDNDAVKVGRAAHTMKSASELFGAERVFFSAFELEKIAQTGVLRDAANAANKLTTEVSKLDDALAATVEA